MTALGITSYVVGYVNGSDASFQFDVGVQLPTNCYYVKMIDQNKIEKNKAVLLADIKAGIAKVTDTTTSRKFPFGYYDRYIFLEGLGVGSNYWSDHAKQEAIKAQELINQK